MDRRQAISSAPRSRRSAPAQIRTGFGAYQMAFWIAGVLCILAGLSFVTIGQRTFRREPPAQAVALAIG